MIAAKEKRHSMCERKKTRIAEERSATTILVLMPSGIRMLSGLVRFPSARDLTSDLNFCRTACHATETHKLALRLRIYRRSGVPVSCMKRH